jgi:nucleoside-diphosphate-sugar epimerase
MKVILTGATGFVGSNVLTHLIADPRVSKITCLTRRPIATTAPKVTTILHEDFASYDDWLLGRLAEHDACIWALGGKASDLGKPDVFAKITYAFTLALANGIASREGKRFTFCYLSGMGADPSETAWFPWEKLTRHLKGRTEKDLGALQNRYREFCAHSFRPGGVLPDETVGILRLVLAPIAVSVGELSKAMIEAAAEDQFFRRRSIITNGDIKRLAKHRLP